MLNNGCPSVAKFADPPTLYLAIYGIGLNDPGGPNGSNCRYGLYGDVVIPNYYQAAQPDAPRKIWKSGLYSQSPASSPPCNIDYLGPMYFTIECFGTDGFLAVSEHNSSGPDVWGDDFSAAFLLNACSLPPIWGGSITYTGGGPAPCADADYKIFTSHP